MTTKTTKTIFEVFVVFAVHLLLAYPLDTQPCGIRVRLVFRKREEGVYEL